jgi:two-component system cell cycle sensor histidine kinase PleC
MSPKISQPADESNKNNVKSKIVSRQKRDNKKITNQKSRITELKKLLVFYKEITETIREPFIILDKDLYVVNANLAFYRKFKVNKKDTEGKLIYELGDNQWDSPELRVLLENILPTNRVLKNFAVTHEFPALGHRTILLNARQVDSKQLILLAMEDVTARWKLRIDSSKMTENLIKQRDQLQRLSDAKDEFISLASHQLRTPATVVKQYTGMLSQGYAGELTEEQLQMLNIASKSNERQLEIRVARVDAGKVYLDKSYCDVVLKVEEVIEGLSILFKSRGQGVIFNKPKTKMVASIDPKLMLMVLENVLDNASKYSSEGKQITINIYQDGNYTVVTIKDHGIGMHKNDLKKLFKKFSRIENPLSISVEDLHEGTIEVTSELNVGSTFKIMTPTNATSSVKSPSVRIK